MASYPLLNILKHSTTALVVVLEVNSRRHDPLYIWPQNVKSSVVWTYSTTQKDTHIGTSSLIPGCLNILWRSTSIHSGHTCSLGVIAPYVVIMWTERGCTTLNTLLHSWRRDIYNEWTGCRTSVWRAMTCIHVFTFLNWAGQNKWFRGVYCKHNKFSADETGRSVTAEETISSSGDDLQHVPTQSFLKPLKAQWLNTLICTDM